MTPVLTKEWFGKDDKTAARTRARARNLGATELRARILGNVSSFKDCWAPQATLAAFLQCSVRTIQRALRWGRDHGLIRCEFGKRGEKPPGKHGAVVSKWSHRWTVGRGLVGDALEAAINAARALAIIGKTALRRTFNAPQAIPKIKTSPRNPPRHLTVEEKAKWLDEQLAIATEPQNPEVVDREPEPPER
jgi:hypothetical protein